MYSSRIKNKVLEDVKRLIKNLSINNKKPNFDSRSERIKIYENDDDVIVYQIKSNMTRQAVRVFIYKIIGSNKIILSIQLRDRNPNTIEHFNSAFTIKETISITNQKDIEPAINKAYDFLNSDSEYIKIPFNKISTCQDPSDLTDSNVLMKTIEEAIEYTNNDNRKCIELTFKDYKEQFIMLLDDEKEIRLPYPDDIFFISKDGRYQTYGQFKAGYHFSF